ncbi:hypothetical protein [Persicitalea jodogahamensis]|nr:hypothetical protein [Persicitalea jodogahamensis]
MKKLFLTFLFLVAVLDAKSQTLHAIMVSDVEDPKLGGISLRDEEAILQILKTAERGTGMKLETYYLNRSSFTAKAVRETLSQMRVDSRDVVFFYYTGLGYYPGSNDKFPTLKLKESALRPLLFFLNDNSLSLDEVGDILQNKGARLNVVMADCRDTVEDLMITEGGIIFDEDMRDVFLKKLFLGSCGLVKVPSATKGKQVWANQSQFGIGSVYTSNFNSTFNDLLEAQFNGVRQATWPQVMRSAESNGIYPRNDDRSRRVDTQQAVYEIKACSASQQRRTTRYAAYKYSLTVGNIQSKLDRYRKSGGDFEKLSDEISRAFRRNAKINLVRKNKYPDSYPQAKKTEAKMSVADFLAQFKSTSAQIQAVYPEFGSFQRTPNKEYLTELTIIEVFDEL